MGELLVYEKIKKLKIKAQSIFLQNSEEQSGSELKISCVDQTDHLDDVIERLEREVKNGRQNALEILFKLYQLKTDDPETFAKARNYPLDVSTEIGAFWTVPTSLSKEFAKSMVYLKNARDAAAEGQETRRVYCPIFPGTDFASRRARLFSTCHRNRSVRSPIQMLEDASELLCSRSSPYQNLELGEVVATFLLRLYRLFPDINRKGGAVPFYELGQGYYGEKFRNRDFDKAIFWLNEARDIYPDMLAIQNILVAHSQLNENYLAPGHLDFNQDLLKQHKDMDRNFPHGAWWNKKDFAAMLMSGYFQDDETENRKRAIDIYWNIYDNRHANDEQDASPIFHGMGILAMRVFLGLDVEQSSQKAREILANLPKNSGGTPVCSGCAQYFADCLNLIETTDQDDEVKRKVDSITGIVRNLYYKRMTFEDAALVLSSNPDYSTQLASDIFRIARYVARNEGWILSKEWSDLSLVVETGLLGLKPEQVRKSALSVGPRYNQVSSNGLPIIGAWEVATNSTKEVEFQLITDGSFVPQPGVVRFDGLSAELGGAIKFRFQTSNEKPALILQEDIDVLMVLTFGRVGNDKEFIWPSLSLEQMDVHHKDFGKRITTKTELLCEKDFEPHWLGYTNIGKTFFYTDYLIGAVAWNSKEFEVLDDDQSNYPGFSAFARSLLYDFRMTGGSIPDDFETTRVMLRPGESIFLPSSTSIDPETNNKTINILCNNIPMRVDGSYWKGDDSSILLNNVDFSQGRLTQKITDHYNDIAMMMPVFERARQLVGIQYTLFKLRSLGYRPPAEVQKELSDRLGFFEALPRLPIADRIMYSPPF